MTSNHIYYRAGYKYQLAEDYKIQLIPDLVAQTLKTKFYTLTVKGLLTIKSGYAWDGPSGPTFDTPDFMRGSLVHDALYQMMRLGQVDLFHRNYADNLLGEICSEDGMPSFRVSYVVVAVKIFAEEQATASAIRKIIVAP